MGGHSKSMDPIERRASLPISVKARGLSGAGKKQKELMKAQLKTKLTNVSASVIRRHRIRYNDAICYEMEETGYQESANYMRKLIQLNQEIREANGPGTFVWLYPMLKNSKEQLDKLREGLTEAENGKKEGNKVKQSEAMLRVAIYFMQLTKAWWWLAEQLLSESVTISKLIRTDGGRREGIARYVFGRFLFLQLEDPTTAREHLKIAREFSMGKKWYAELNIPQETIFFESCVLLSKVLIQLSREIRPLDPLKAARTCSIALKRANDTKSPKVIAEAMLELGLCNLEGGEFMAALRNFTRNLDLNTKIADDVGICEGYIHMALAYTKLGQTDHAEQHLLKVIELADSKPIPYYRGQGERFLGEFYLNHGSTDMATVHLINSFNNFYEIGCMDEAEQSRSLSGISAGTEMMFSYTRLILRSGPRDFSMKYLSKMCQWKAHREPFWVVEEGDIDSASIRSESLDSILTIDYLKTIIDELIENTVAQAPHGANKHDITKIIKSNQSLKDGDDDSDDNGSAD